MDDDGVIRSIDAIRAGQPVLLATDTVYGLVTSIDRKEAALGVYRLKGREPAQPTALLAADVDALLECLPELKGKAETIARLLLPGPYTLVLPNPARRYRWLCGERPDSIGVRVPNLPAASSRVVEAVGCVMATSANEHGGPNPATLADVPGHIRAACAAEVDAGPLPGTPSTVIDFTGTEPHVIRDGIASAGEAIGRVRAALAA